jgi:hypothetical protein
MVEHKLKMVVNRTMETGKWVADIKVDKAKNETTIVFSQRKNEFAPGRWIADRIAGLTSAAKLSKKYLQALNYYPDSAFGATTDIRHVRKNVDQKSIDRKFKEASTTLRANNSVAGPIGSPFAQKTKDFSSVKVIINDSFEWKQRKDEAISSILSELENQGASFSKGDKAYYAALLNIALNVTEGNGKLTEYGSDAESAFTVLKTFQTNLAKSENESVRTWVDQLLDTLDKKLHPTSMNGQAPTKPLQLSSPDVYGRRPIKPPALTATKNKTPEP